MSRVLDLTKTITGQLVTFTTCFLKDDQKVMSIRTCPRGGRDHRDLVLPKMLYSDGGEGSGL